MKKRLMLAAVLAAAPFVASAQGNGLSYTYVEGGYTQANIDYDDELLGDFTADGGYIRGSFELSPSFYVFGSYSQGKDDDSVAIDFGGGDVVTFDVEDELKQGEFGLGYHMAMGEKVDFIGELAYVRLDEDFSFSTSDGDSGSDDLTSKGGRAALGLRGGSDSLEGWVKLGYIDLGEVSGDFIGTAGGQYKFNKTWGIVAEVEVIDDLSRFSAGVRASF